MKFSRALGARGRHVLWKGGKESTQHLMLQGCEYPRFMRSAAGCTTCDVDGHRYIDYLMGWGTVLLGYNHADVETAVHRQLARGCLFNLPTEEEVSLAERLVRVIPGATKVRFLTTGAEGTQAAVRVARAATCREEVLQCGFHGWLDWCQGSHPSGIPRATLSSVRTFPYNDLNALSGLLSSREGSVACVIMEAVKDEMPADGYLASVREITHHHGALLIFDEAKTGFRLSLGGAQAHFGVLADLCVFSKALANGYPLAALTGRDEVFDRAAEAWVSGTYHGWPASIAAAHATLDVLERHQVTQHVWTLGKRLMAGFNDIMERHGLSTRLTGVAAMPQLRPAEGEARIIEQLFSGMVRRGYFIHPLRPWFVSYAHDGIVIEQTLAAADDAAQEAISA